MKKDKKWLKEAVDELPCVDTVFVYDGVSYIDTAVSVNQVYNLIYRLEEPEVLSQEWIDEHSDGPSRCQYVWVNYLKELLVPNVSEMETVDITEGQIMDWLDDNDFFHHATAETVLANAVDKGELGYYGTKYSVVKKEPEIDGISCGGGGMNNLKITVTNPYYEKEYVAIDVTLSDWIYFLENHRMGNEECFSFLDTSGNHVVVNPGNFASIEIEEVAE